MYSIGDIEQTFHEILRPELSQWALLGRGFVRWPSVWQFKYQIIAVKGIILYCTGPKYRPLTLAVLRKVELKVKVNYLYLDFGKIDIVEKKIIRLEFITSSHGIFDAV